MKKRKINYGAVLLILLENGNVFLIFAALCIAHIVGATLVLNDALPIKHTMWIFIPEYMIGLILLVKLFNWIVERHIRHIQELQNKINEKTLTEK